MALPLHMGILPPSFIASLCLAQFPSSCGFLYCGIAGPCLGHSDCRRILNFVPLMQASAPSKAGAPPWPPREADSRMAPGTLPMCTEHLPARAPLKVTPLGMLWQFAHRPITPRTAELHGRWWGRFPAPWRDFGPVPPQGTTESPHTSMLLFAGFSECPR